MGLKKPGAAIPEVVPQAAVVLNDAKAVLDSVHALTTAPAAPIAENGTDAAIARLKQTKPVEKAAVPHGRDFDAEARGKTRCNLYGQALASPSIAGMKWNGSAAELKALIREMADDGVAYSFNDPK